MIKRFLFFIPIIILLGVGLYFILTTSPFVRYWADDFCSAVFLRNNGYLRAQVLWWQSWTGRYSYIAFLDLFESIGPWVVRFLPILIAILMTVSLIPVFFFESILAPLFILLVLINAPNLTQSFYWQVGSLNYAFEFIFFNLFISLIIWPKRKFAYLLAFILPFIAGGFSEAFALPQIILIVFMMFLVYIGNFSEKKMRIRLLIIGLAGAILSILIMLLSPGNAVRSSLVDHLPNFFEVIKSTVNGTELYFINLIHNKPFLYSFALLFSAIYIAVNRNWGLFKKVYKGVRSYFFVMVGSILTAIISTGIVIFSGFYGDAIAPPDRTMFIAIYAIFICFFVFSFYTSLIFIKVVKKSWQEVLVYIMLVVVLIMSLRLVKEVFVHWQIIKWDMATYSTVMYKNEKVLNESHKTGTVPIINNATVGGLDSFTDNDGWVLSCVKGYYQVSEIKLK